MSLIEHIENAGLNLSIDSIDLGNKKLPRVTQFLTLDYPKSILKITKLPTVSLIFCLICHEWQLPFHGERHSISSHVVLPAKWLSKILSGPGIVLTNWRSRIWPVVSLVNLQGDKIQGNFLCKILHTDATNSLATIQFERAPQPDNTQRNNHV